jgi:hypothetical protein
MSPVALEQTKAAKKKDNHRKMLPGPRPFGKHQLLQVESIKGCKIIIDKKCFKAKNNKKD